MIRTDKSAIIITVLLVALLMFNLTGCGAQQSQVPEKPEVINIGYSLRPLNVPTIVAQEKNMFEQAFAEDGIEVKWHELEGPSTTEALAAGAIDMAVSLNYVTAIISKASGNQINIISSFAQFPQAIGLLASKDSGVESVADLKGKKIAVKKGTMLQEMLIKALEEAQVKVEDLEVVDMESANAANAVLLKQVDAAVLPDPLLMKTLASGETVLLRNAEDLILGQSVIAARSEFLEQYPDLARKFLQVQKEAWQWSINNSEEALNLAAEVNNMDLKAVNVLYPKFDFSLEIDQQNVNKLKESADFLQANGIIDKEIDTQALITDLVDTGYLPK
ncbi:MAG: aliphatic sulfonate ABC transporter substrate-binding protein [Peptococcaceae bacterium]|nr:aliphatic sulfonate ABC transporter substrate-binding protein [Peptococcaceae bacterium]